MSQPSKYLTLVSLTTAGYKERESLNVLLSQGLITFGVTTSQGVRIGGLAATTFHGLDNFTVTEMGQSFYKAVNK